jgi:hypothetical protein
MEKRALLPQLWFAHFELCFQVIIIGALSMERSSSSYVSLSSEIDVMVVASGDDHKWRRKCEELKKNKEAVALMRLLVA